MTEDKISSSELGGRQSIRLLDRHTANQIAAGEVVERPASVVKELVENAIDAGAGRIDVRLFGAACDKIQVSDNGWGLSPADMRLAIQRHATSKISRVEDLDSLSTLGFRGEALPSIASVSRFTLTSRQRGADSGYRLTVEDGKAAIPEETAAQAGTTALVENLFYNTPARRKFLKSPRTELGMISDIIGRLAISHPGIAFSLKNGNHSIIVTSGNGDLAQAVLAVYGRETVENLLYLKTEGDLSLSGLLSLPSFNRAARDHYAFFINGRSVRSRELAEAVEDGYYTLLPPRRFPAVFLFLELPPQSLDVNVHPGKLEIKLRDAAQVKRAVTEAVRFSLYKSERLIPRLPLSVSSRDRVDLPPPKPETGFAPISVDALPQALTARESGALSAAQLHRAFIAGLQPGAARDMGYTLPLSTAPAEQTALDWSGGRDMRYQDLQILGQLCGAFIVAAGRDGLYLIDQHAAAERISYEQMLAQEERAERHSEMLALPLKVELTYQEHLLLVDRILALRELGFILEYFGGTSYIIRGVPDWHTEGGAENLLRALLDLLKQGTADINKLRREELFMAACKRSVKANRYLSRQEMSALLNQLDACEQPFTCPHGRPLIVKLSEAEIRKRFLRSSI